MWSMAMTVASVAWILMGVYLVYSTGTLFILGNYHQFFLALLLWILCNIAIVVFTALS